MKKIVAEIGSAATKARRSADSPKPKRSNFDPFETVRVGALRVAIGLLL
jgi:hypothetical protein